MTARDSGAGSWEAKVAAALDQEVAWLASYLETAQGMVRRLELSVVPLSPKMRAGQRDAESWRLSRAALFPLPSWWAGWAGRVLGQ